MKKVRSRSIFNQDILKIVDERYSLINSVRVKRWKMIVHTLRHPEKFNSTIVEGIVEIKRLGT